MFNKILPKTICHFFTTLFVSKIVPNYIFCRQHLPKIFFWVFLKSDLLLLLQIFAEKTRKKSFVPSKLQKTDSVEMKNEKETIEESRKYYNNQNVFFLFCLGHRKIPECISKLLFRAIDCQCPTFSFVFYLKKIKSKVILKHFIAATTTNI